MLSGGRLARRLLAGAPPPIWPAAARGVAASASGEGGGGAPPAESAGAPYVGPLSATVTRLKVIGREKRTGGTRVQREGQAPRSPRFGRFGARCSSSLLLNLLGAVCAGGPRVRGEGRGARKAEVFCPTPTPLPAPFQRLSLFSCALTTFSAPAIATLDAAAPASPAAQAGVALAVAAFGGATTGLLQWFTAPYVHEMTVAQGREAAAGETVRVRTLTWAARPRWETLHLSSLRPPTGVHPQTTFSGGPGGRNYYVDADACPKGMEGVMARLQAAGAVEVVVEGGKGG